jgi:hypothetical protein
VPGGGHFPRESGIAPRTDRLTSNEKGAEHTTMTQLDRVDRKRYRTARRSDKTTNA